MIVLIMAIVIIAITLHEIEIYPTISIGPPPSIQQCLLPFLPKIVVQKLDGPLEEESLVEVVEVVEHKFVVVVYMLVVVVVGIVDIVVVVVVEVVVV